MSDDLTIGIRLAADGSAWVGTVKVSREELDKLTDTTKKAGDEAKRFGDKQAALAGQLRSVAREVVAYWAAWKIGETIKDMALLNARHETLGVVMGIVGRNAGYSAAQMEQYAQQVQKMGITMIESRQSVIDMAQAQIDLSKSSQLARVAQDAAVIGGINSSEAFSRMVYGIKSAQVEVLRTIGLNVSFEDSYKKLATQIGKKTTALTEAEKAQARANAVLEAGELIAGSYEAAMGTAGKQITSLARYVEDLKVVLGETFNDALVIAVESVTAEFKGMNQEARELAQQGQLREWGRDAVQILAFVADAGRGVKDVFVQIGESIAMATIYLEKNAEVAKLAWNPISAVKNLEEIKRVLRERDAAVAAFRDDAEARWMKPTYRDQASRYFDQKDRSIQGARGRLTFANKADADHFRTLEEEIRDMQGGITAAGRSSKSTAADPGKRATNFLQSLTQEIEQLGKGEEAMLRLKAAQLGVASAADPLITKLMAAKVAHQALIDRQEAHARATENEIDRLNRQEMAHSDAMEAANRFTRTKQEEIDQIRLSTSVMGQSASAQRLTMEAARLDLEIRKESLNVLPEYRDEFLQIAKVMRDEYLVALNESIEASRSFETGMKSALSSYRDEATNTAKQTERVFSTGLRKAEDAIVRFARTGKLSMRDFADSVIEELLRIQAQKVVSGIAGNLLSLAGSFFGGGGGFGDWFGAASGATYGTNFLSEQSLMLAAQWHRGGTPAYDNGDSRMVQSSVFATAPRFHSGIGPNEQAAVIRRDESVLTPGQMRQLAPVGAMGAQAIRVEIVNQGQPQEVVSAQPSFDPEGMVVKIITQDQRRGGPITRGFENTFGLRRSGA